MNIKTLEIAENEAKRFLEKCKELRDHREEYYHKKSYFASGTKFTGAVKRSSMDLSRALADIRKSY
jgi:hypothetical protein